jgi:tetratricopeptide (TPR) repeat protein
MTAKFLRWPAALLFLTIAASLGAAQYGGASSTPSSSQAPPDSKSKDKGDKNQKIDKKEEAAYKAFYAARTGDPNVQIQLGEDFATKFPQSHYLSGVYSTLTSAYYVSGNTDKMFEDGAKALALDPDNVDVLSLLAMAIPRRVKATTPDGAQQLVNAEKYAHHAIELIPNMAKPAEIDDATFEKAKNDKLSLCHSGLGLIYLNHSKFDDARTELTQAIALASNPDIVDYYLLGNADTGASYFHDAVTAYQKCSETGPLTAPCKQRAASAQHDAETKMGR